MGSIINYTGVYGSGTALTAARLLKKNEGQGIILTSTANKAARLAKDLAFFSDAPVYVLPDLERAVLRFEAKSTSELSERLGVLTKLALGENCIVIAPVMGALKKLPPKDVFLKDFCTVRFGQQIERSELVDRLVRLGYERMPAAEAPGQFAVRGDIIDICPPGSQDSVRIELFDTEVDSIRLLDPNTQRSKGNINSVTLTPAQLLVRDDEANSRAIEMISKAHHDETGDYLLHCIMDGVNTQLLENYISYFYSEPQLIFDYVSIPSFILVDDPERIDEIIDFNDREEDEDRSTMLERGEAVSADFDSRPDTNDYRCVYEFADEFDVVYCTPFAQQLKNVPSLGSLENLSLRQAPVFNGHMETLESELKRFVKNGYDVSLVISSEDRIENLKDFLERCGIERKVHLLRGQITAGICDDETKEIWISEQDIFPSIKERSRRSKREKKGQIKAFTDIKIGDYVVHEAHGVGRFAGVRKMEVQGSVSDYLRIEYAGTDVLYVPVDHMDTIQKYLGSEGIVPKISGLSGGAWEKTKARAKEAIREMALELLKRAAQRQMEPGYKFGPDSAWQKEFEDAFPYEETGDQLRCIEEIKQDMESDKAMDRLLCGDVGFGKTEVAARAIFKCLEQGKQAAILVPTTVLCSQHYRTFLKRFADYPFHMDMLCRFRTDRQQDAIVAKLKTGDIDFVVGTHRLLSSDIRFKDLGLLVVDEEQRFGVEHKEAIKRLKNNTDVLTLSATPIPRTLHMSLTGIRDMSVIDEPPQDRYPVQTYVLEEDDRTIADAIRRELGRGGQVYVVYNMVKGINQVARHLQELVPEANIIVGHGQMGDRQLEDVMQSFIDGEANVLLSTTIIESGLDIPNVNTMIVLNADHFGLSQLYQLRGRVGRSNRMAYAYLVYKKDKVLSEIAEKRLRAMREFTEFGSGFRVAMRDLEIRGAGNILGTEQSGHMVQIGYELYCKLVEETIRELQGETEAEEPVKEIDTSIELAIPAYLPEYYVSDEMTRLSMYKKIAAVSSFEEHDEIFDELVDRFGDPPTEAQNLMDIALIRHLAGRLGMDRVFRQGNKLIFTFEELNGFDPARLAVLMDKYGARLTVFGGQKPRLSLLLQKTQSQKEALKILGILSEPEGSKK